MSSSPTRAGMGTLYVNDFKAQIASILGSRAAATGTSPSGSPATEGCGAARRPQARREGGGGLSQRNSPFRHGSGIGDFDSVTPPPEAVPYSVSASRGTPLVTPTRGSSANRSGERAKRARRRSRAAPLLDTSAFVATPTPQKQRHHHLSPATSARDNKRKSSRARRVTTSASRRRSRRRDGAQRVGSPSAGHTNVTLATGVGGGYAIHVNRHPLYSGRGAPQRKCTSPPPAADKAAGVQGGLAISVEANTVRRLQRGGAEKPAASVAATKTAPVKAATASGVCATASAGQTRPSAQRGSIIEQLAAATQIKGGDGSTLGQAAHEPHANASVARSSSPRKCPRPHSESKLWLSRLTGGSDTKPLGPLRLQDRMRMHLQQASCNVSVSAAGEADRRLQNDTLVFAGPERTPDGEENPMYAQLKAFQLPQAHTAAPPTPAPPSLPGSATTGSTSAAAPSAAPPPPAAPGAVTAAAVTGLASAPSPAPAAGIPAPVVPPPPPGADVLAAAAFAGAPAASPAPPPPPPPPPPPAVAAGAGAANAPATGGSAAGTGASAAAAASGARLSAQPVSAREPTREEMAEAEEERLLRDLIAASHHDHRCARPPPSAGSAVPATDAGLTAAIETALQLRREANSGALHGWRRPPANVLLPDPTQSAPTWAVLKSAPAQEAQQAAAAAAIARPRGGASVDQSASRADDMTAAAHDIAENAADGDEAARVLDCIDYHAPFQCVLRPEYVEHDLVPAALSVGVAAHTGMDDPMKSCRTNRTTPGAAAAAAAAKRDNVNADALAAVAAASSDTAVKTLAAQAVILRDPLSLLACEHLAEDTIDITARRRAYLSAMDALHGITRDGALVSTLQEASPLSAVFCELSYPAKVLLSAILYMRSLGALPSLLRVGPLTEYSPVVDKENCIELVFYNPPDEEQGVRAAQEKQQKSGQLKPSRHPFERERAVGATVLHRQVPAGRVSLIEAVTPTNAPGRARSQPHAEGQPSSSPGASFRSRSGRQYGNTTRNFTGDSLAGKGEAHASHAHNYTDPSPSPLQKRRPTALEDRLMSTLSATAMRRAGPATSRSVSSAAVTSRTVSPHRFFSRAISTNLAGPQLRDTEASLMAGITLDGVRRWSGADGGEPCPSESGGSWLLRNASQDGPAPHVFARQVGDPGTNADESLSGSDNVHRGYADLASGRQRRQKLSQLPAKLQGCGSGCASAFATRVPRVRITPPSGTSATTATGSSALRRSSVIVALEDLQRAAERGGVSAAARAANAPSSPSHSLPGRTDPLSAVTQPAKAMPPRPPTHFEAGQSATACGARAAATPASGSTPASAHGPGFARFPTGEQELCVVLRAVVAQKSHVYSFGKAETVHVLPPLLRRSADDDGDKAVLRKQTTQKAEMERLATDASSPLHKFLCGGDKLCGEAQMEGDQWRAALLDQARRAAAAARQRVPVAVNENGMQTSADYGDLVVAFVLSGNASELSGSVPDMMELEALRYRIFSLLGYSASDPAGMRAVKEAAGVGGASAAAQPPAEAVTPSSTTAPSPLEPNLARLQQHFASFKALHTPASPHPKARETLSFGASSASPCASLVGSQRRPSFFEEVLQRADPLADLYDGDGKRGRYLTEFDVQQRQTTLQQRQKQDVQALMLQRYPIYRASSVAESTLQAFFAEAKEAVVLARQQGRRRDDAKSSSGRPSTSGARFSSPDQSLDPLTRYTRGDAATTALQDSERDLLRFRPMSLNSFHRELTDAVQCALDLQIRQGKKDALHAFHM